MNIDQMINASFVYFMETYMYLRGYDTFVHINCFSYVVQILIKTIKSDDFECLMYDKCLHI